MATLAKAKPDDQSAGLEVRSDIVEAATKVFSRRGYHAASMTEIAEEVGIRKASLYHHVRKKEDLLFAIHDQMIDELIAETMAISSSSTEAPEKLHRVLHVTMGFIARNRDGVTVFLSERNTLRGERWQALVVKRDFYEQMVKQIVAEGVSTGDFADIPPGLAARAVLGMANWGYTWFQPEGPLSADQVADVFSTIALRGLEAR
ncbi:MAG TPA: TetR/AcrR family transcriptional regulator [Solirubrobacterales bacterium]|nr:TetR/AcrR family transcriptional regulator [Solirubrobacterales bacterium]